MSGALLLDEPLLCYQPALVRRLGLAEAAIVQQLQYWTRHSTNSHDGHLWVYKTYDAWSDEIGISAKAVRGALKRLRDDGAVIAIQSPLDARDRTLWWRIDRSVIEGPSAPRGRPEDRPSDTPGGDAASAPQGSSHAGDRCSTEITTETTKKETPASEKKIALPADFPDELRPHLRAAYRVLRDLAERHAAKEVNVCALAHLVMANHRKPLVLAAHECAAHWEGKGGIKDAVAAYRNWLRNADALAVIEPLDDEGRTTQIARPGGLRDNSDGGGDAKSRARMEHSRAQVARFAARAENERRLELTA